MDNNFKKLEKKKVIPKNIKTCSSFSPIMEVSLGSEKEWGNVTVSVCDRGGFVSEKDPTAAQDYLDTIKSSIEALKKYGFEKTPIKNIIHAPTKKENDLYEKYKTAKDYP